MYKKLLSAKNVTKLFRQGTGLLEVDLNKYTSIYCPESLFEKKNKIQNALDNLLVFVD